MGRPLTSTEISQLQVYVDASDRIGYYSTLASWGYGYPALALGVVNNDSLAGATANIFFLNQASAEGVNLEPEQYAQLSVDLMLEDWAARLLLVGTSPGEDLPYDTVQAFHQDVFGRFGISADAWTPNIALNLLTSPGAKEALWDTMLMSPTLSYASILALALTDIDNPITETYLANVTAAGTLALASPSNEFGNYALDLPDGGKLIGDDQNDDLSLGTEFNDVVIGFDGEDTIKGLDGNDHIYGGEGIDRLIGGHGDDLIVAGNAGDTIYTGDLDDTATPAVHSDTDDDAVFAEAGEDVVYSNGGYDIISLGDDNDEIHVKNENEEQFPSNHAVIWGGDGIDSFYFGPDAHILAVTVNNMSEELLKNLSIDSMFSYFNQNMEYPYDYILINAEQHDKIFVDGVQLTSATINSVLTNHEELYDGYDFTQTDIVDGRKVFDVTSISDWVFDSYSRGFQMSGSGIYVDVYDGGYGATLGLFDVETGASFDLDGFVDGMAGVTLAGDANREYTVVTRSKSDIEVHSIDHTNYYPDEQYNIPGDYEVTSQPVVTITTEEEDWLLKPDSYDSAVTPEVDLAPFQYGTVSGTGGDDVLTGSVAPERFDGGAGNDTADYSGSSDGVSVDLDLRKGSDGDADGDRYSSIENVRGTDFRDDLIGSSSNNVLASGDDDDFLQGLAGDDILDGGAGWDTLLGGWGNDLIDGGADYDSIYLMSENLADYEFLRNGDNSVTMISDIEGIDTLVDVEEMAAYSDEWTYYEIEDLAPSLPTANAIDGTNGDDSQVGTASNDVIAGFDGNDTIEAGDGNDVVNAGAGDDTLIGGIGNDILNGGDGQNQVRYEGSLTDYTFTAFGDKTLVRSQVYGIDILTNIQTAFFVGENAIYSLPDLTPVTGPDTIVGTGGNDTLLGTSGDDVISGLAGDDLLQGGEGSDTYIYSLGDGSDYIDDEANQPEEIDALRLIDLASDDVGVTRDGVNLKLTVLATGDTISIDEQFWSPSDFWGFERIEFADGLVWDRDTLMSFVTTVTSTVGTNGDDRLVGAWNDETFEGGLGNDTLLGSLGADIYIYSAGDGTDYIDDEANEAGIVDIVRFTDLNASDITASRDGINLKLTVLATGDTITIDEQYHSGTEFWGIEKIEFADGSFWNRQTVMAIGGSGDEATVVGTSGDDTLTGTWENDVFRGEQGDDTLIGSAGSDTYLYTSGDGSDVVRDEEGYFDNFDILRFNDLTASDIVVTRYGDAIKLGITATDDVITIGMQLRADPGYWGLEKIEFADGTSWDRNSIVNLGLTAPEEVTVSGTNGDDTLQGTYGHDLFQGGLGNDILLGGEGSDTYLYALGDGTDYIDDEANQAAQLDILRLTDLNQSDISASRSGVNLQLTVLATGDTITIDEQYYSDDEYWGFEKIEFADGNSWDRDDLMSIGSPPETEARMASNSITASDASPATADDAPAANVIEFPTTAIQINVSDHELLPATNGQGEGSSSDTEDSGSAEIISLSDFLHATEDAGVTCDLWYEPEPIGAVI